MKNLVKISLTTVLAITALSFSGCSDNKNEANLTQQINKQIRDKFRNENAYQKQDDYSFALLNHDEQKIKIYESILSDAQIANAKKGVEVLKTKLNTLLRNAAQTQQGKMQLKYFLNNIQRLSRWKYINSDFVPAAKKILGEK